MIPKTMDDLFGREYTDYSLGWGSVILGHAHPVIAESVKRQVEIQFPWRQASQPWRNCESPEAMGGSTRWAIL